MVVVCINDVFVDTIKRVHLLMGAVSLWTRPRPCTCLQGGGVWLCVVVVCGGCVWLLCVVVVVVVIVCGYCGCGCGCGRGCGRGCGCCFGHDLMCVYGHSTTVNATRSH